MPVVAKLRPVRRTRATAGWGAAAVFAAGCVFAAVFAAGCAAPRSPYFDDARFLRFGVDPFEEADTLARQFEEAGHRVALRVRGQHFSAFGTLDGRGRPSAVRVVTLRGVTLARDSEPGDALHEPRTYRLLAPPIAGTQDADGDGFEEVFVERFQPSVGHGCLGLYRVRDVGFVDEVPLPDRALGEPGCVEAVRDVDADGRAELLLVARLISLGRAGARAPELPLLLVPVNHRFEVRPAEGALAAEALASREGALDLARARGDVEAVYRLALELALLAALSGAEPEARLSELDARLAGALSDTESVQRARAFLEAALPPLAQWPEPSGSPGAP